MRTEGVNEVALFFFQLGGACDFVFWGRPSSLFSLLLPLWDSPSVRGHFCHASPFELTCGALIPCGGCVVVRVLWLFGAA